MKERRNERKKEDRKTERQTEKIDRLQLAGHSQQKEGLEETSFTSIRKESIRTLDQYILIHCYFFVSYISTKKPSHLILLSIICYIGKCFHKVYNDFF